MKRQGTRLLFAFGMGVLAVTVAVTISTLRGSLSVDAAIYSVAAAAFCAGAVVLLIALSRALSRRSSGDH